ncbi:amino acid permease [Nocardia sp. SYP-A9097]|uniref:APC family permease n=1 Tax=Nocardia sp. SYP-A9097 TaxID=2663237 RepID=UPI00129BFD03|nr:APC family permease [Nocardia sp. SYP-A9097]MRH90238.1 amino acid permease [Nocardia sp. SYP-A9097]
MTNTPMRRSLGVLDNVVIAASSTAATTSIGIGLGLTAGIVGLHLPIIMLLAIVPVACIAGAYARLNRVEPNAGNTYVWVGRSLNPWLGFLCGWVMTVSMVLFLAYTTTVTGSSILALAGQAGLHNIGGLELTPDSTLQSTLVGLVVLVAAVVTAIVGVDLAAKVQSVLLVFEYVVLLGFCGYGLFVGTQPFSLDWINPFDIPSSSAFVQGIVIAVFCYWGFDSAFSMTEECHDSRTSGRAGAYTLILMLSLFVLASFAFQRVLPLDDMADHGAEGLVYFGNALATSPLTLLPMIALTFSAVASLQSGVLPTVRGMYAMSRDRTLGPVWARVHPRYGTPAAGTLLLGALAVVVCVVALAIPKVPDLIYATVNAIGIVVALYYAATALAAASRFRGLLRGGLRDALGAVILPIIGAIILLTLAVLMCLDYATGTDHYEVAADNGWFILSVPLVMILSGIAVAAWAKWVRRSPYFLRPERGTLVIEEPALPESTLSLSGATE